MDSIVEENGNSNIDALSEVHVSQASSNIMSNSTATTTVLTTGANVVQYMPAHNIQVQSVIQANQSSVIQTPANIHPVTLSKGVLYVNKPNTVIHTTLGNSVVQIKHEPTTTPIMDTNSEESLSDDDSQSRRELTRRPSYHKILSDISGPDIGTGTALQLQESGGIHTIGTTGGGSGTLIQLSQESASTFYIPSNTNTEDQTRKREIRLQKNREAARECRRKKKEYIKCLENRVAVLENQNKALIEELKSLKQLYCAQKND